MQLQRQLVVGGSLPEALTQKANGLESVIQAPLWERE